MMSNGVNWYQQIERVAVDKLSGASEITRNCARALIAYTDQESPVTIENVQEVVLSIAERVLCSKPSMASVVRFLNDAVLAVANVDEVGSALDSLRQVSNEYIALVERASTLVAETALKILPAEGTVLTLSYSAAVAKSLVVAQQQGHKLRVICLESRPNYEGRVLAAQLSDNGLEVVLTIDAAMYGCVGETDVFVVGADSLTDMGVVNKVGTASLAAGAQVLDVPGYVMADTSKIWPSELRMPLILEQPSIEVWDQPPNGVRVRNYYFDLTPWDGFRGVVTERGVLSRAEVGTLGRGIEVAGEMGEILRRLWEIRQE